MPLTKGVYQGDWSSFVPSPPVGNKDPPVLGRLADLCPVPRPSFTRHRIGSLPHQVPGAPSELDEKQSGAMAAGGVCQAAPGLCRNIGVTYLLECGEHLGPPVLFSPQQAVGVGTVPEVVGHDFSCTGRWSSGSPQGSVAAEMAECSQHPPEVAQT